MRGNPIYILGVYIILYSYRTEADVFCSFYFSKAGTMSGLANMYDLRDEEQAKDYLNTLGTEYRFQCFHEKIPEGCHRLGDHLEAFQKDLKKARSVYEENCVDGKYGHSCFKIGNYKLIGKACEKNAEHALKYYQQGCEYGYPPSCQNAALMYQTGKTGEKPDFVKATEYLEKGCEGNNVTSCYLLSSYYIQGRVVKDMAKAHAYAVKACEGGHMHACANASIMYRNGDGVTKSEKLAAEYQERAKELQESVAKPLQGIVFGET